MPGLMRARGLFAQAPEFLLDLFQFFVGELFEVYQLVTRARQSSNEFVQFEMDGLRVAVLRILDQEHHQEGHDSCAGVDDKLPCVRIMKGRPEGCPDDDDQKGNRESGWAAQDCGALSRKNMKSVLHATEKAALIVLFCAGVVVGFNDSNLSFVFPKADARMK